MQICIMKDLKFKYSSKLREILKTGFRELLMYDCHYFTIFYTLQFPLLSRFDPNLDVKTFRACFFDLIAMFHLLIRFQALLYELGQREPRAPGISYQTSSIVWKLDSNTMLHEFSKFEINTQNERKWDTLSC